MSSVSQLGRAPRLLLVDDNTGDILLMRKTFSRLDIAADFITANSGEEGVVSLKSCSDLGFLPDLILLDLNLPGMNGLEFLNVVKAQPDWRRIPVIILSSSSADKDVLSSYDSFASGYITKPYSATGYEEAAFAIVGYWFRLTQSPYGSSKSLAAR